MTTVEWLFEKIEALPIGDPAAADLLEDILKYKTQARSMETTQLKFFFDKGHLYSGCPHGFQEVYLRTLKPRRYES